MVFSNSKKKVLNQKMLTSQGNDIEVMSTYKYYKYKDLWSMTTSLLKLIQNLVKKL